MICPNCEQEYADDIEICEKCGSDIEPKEVVNVDLSGGIIADNEALYQLYKDIIDSMKMKGVILKEDDYINDP